MRTSRGEPVRAVLIAIGEDEDFDELRYKFESIDSNWTKGPSKERTCFIDWPVTNEYGYSRYTVTVYDDWGPGQSITIEIPLFPKNSTWAEGQKLWDAVNSMNENYRELARRGQLMDPSALVAPSFRVAKPTLVPDGAAPIDPTDLAAPAQGALAKLGRRWISTSELGWSGDWARRGDSNVFDAAWTHPQHGRVTATLIIDIDASNNVVIRRTDISSTKPPPGWAPGKTCIYRGKMDASGNGVTGKTSCEWAREPFRWSARIDSEDGRQRDTRTEAQEPSCNWQFTGMIADHTADDDPPFSSESATPLPARCHPGYAGNTATCWDGVRIRHPGSPNRAWCTYKHVPKSAYVRGGNAGNVYECACG